MGSSQHYPLLLLLTVTTPLVFAVTLVFTFLSTSTDTDIIFRQSQAIITEKYYLEITPAGWGFSIWGLIYVQQGLWLIYALILLCRKGPEGPLYVNPVLLSSPLFIIYALNLVLNILWLVVFDNELLEASFIVLVLVAFTLYVCMGISYQALHENRTILSSQGRKVDDILIRIFVHNGLGTYAAWTTIASFLNMAFVIAYRSNPVIDQSLACTIALGFITAVLIVFVVTDLTILDRFSRYTVTPYAVVIWALGASLSKNWFVSFRNTIFTAVLMVLGVIFLIVKLVLVIVRSRTKPIISSSHYNVNAKDDDNIMVRM